MKVQWQVTLVSVKIKCFMDVPWGPAKEMVLRLPDASLGRYFSYGEFAPSDPLHSVNEM